VNTSGVLKKNLGGFGVITKKQVIHSLLPYNKQIMASLSRGELEAKLLSFAKGPLGNTFRERAVSEILKAVQPSDIIPEIYGGYRQIVYDGVCFLLSHISLSRLISLSADQLQLPDSASHQERLIRLAGQIPTLHKLGQIIARNQNIDISFKSWLITLENGCYGTDIHIIRQMIEAELGELIKTFSIEIEPEILSEASVGTVAAFRWTNPDTGKISRGVFKVIRPGIRESLNEELELLDDMAHFFDVRRNQYPLKNFRFKEIFKDIRDALGEEIDLLGEQAHLKAAAAYSGKYSPEIPGLLPFSTRNVTAMTYAEGVKVTDADMSRVGKKKCASELFRAVLWNPLFSYEDNTMFHGDPHAGNIHAVETADRVKVTLLDWSLVGFLSKSERMNMLRLILGIIIDDKDTICEAIATLSEDRKDHSFFQRRTRIAQSIMKSREYTERRFIEKVFYFIDQMLIKGVCFSANLVFFRKAMFTLDGVLKELDPKFDADICVLNLLKDVVMEELPRRCAYLFFPRSDSPEHYKSLMSNTDLQILFMRLWTNLLRNIYLPYQRYDNYAELAGI
jgi:ubiquinone biosynthesis protein